MCGIIAAYGKNPHEQVLKQYNKQWTRGNEGFGFIALKDNKIVMFARETTEAEITDRLFETIERKPDAILFHHRFPTSTINVKAAAHPLPIQHKSWAYDYYILHNGVISGADKSEREIEAKGYKFQSRVDRVHMYRAGGKLYEVVDDSEVNDSEVLGYYIAEYLEGKSKEIPVMGAIAAIVVQVSKKTGHCKTYYMRNYGNPLYMQRDKKAGTVVIASEVDGAPIPAHMVHRMTRSLSLSSEFNVTVGRSYIDPVGGYSVGYGRGYGDSYGAGYDNVPPRASETKPLNLPAAKDEPKPEVSTDGIVSKAIADYQGKADTAYADLVEAEAVYANLGDMADDERKEAEEFIQKLEAAWLEAEHDLRDLLEENGKSYDESRTERAYATA